MTDLSTQKEIASNYRFISIEGIEGVGKSTVIKHIAAWLSEQHQEVVTTREPGGTPIAEDIRSVLLSHHEELMHPQTELLLMFAGRVQHIANVILPALHAGKWVICDRYVDASYAYQGAGRGLGEQAVHALQTHFVPMMPGLTFLLDAPVEIGQARISGRGKDRIEREKHVFFQSVRDCYLSRAEKELERFRVIDATQNEANVAEDVIKQLEAYL